MRKLVRPDAPPPLDGREQEFNDKHLKRLSNGGTFSWFDVGGKDIRAWILPTLHAMTADHCSFCDCRPIAHQASEAIEHFKPKSKFPELAFTWSNLFYCCDHCQKVKGSKWDDLLLKPDEVGYSFNKYFVVETSNGQIRPNPAASMYDQSRAACSIEMYKLDSQKLRTERMTTAHYWSIAVRSGEKINIDDFPYRFFLEP